jgi:serine protein kinase
LYVTKSDRERYEEWRRQGWLDGEGLHGLDPRFIINRLAALMVNPDRECIDPLSVLKSIQDGVERDLFLDKSFRARVLEWLEMAREWYNREVERDVLEAFHHDWGDELANLYNNYLDNVVLWVRSNRNGRGWDEALLRSIEERMNISELEAPNFREEIYSRLEIAKKQHQSLNFLEHAGLHRALREKLMDDMKDEVKVTTQTPVPDRRTLEKIERAATQLVASGRYCPQCAAKAIHHVGGLLNR